MVPSRHPYAARVLACGAAALLLTGGVAAQSSNLLRNFGFEQEPLVDPGEVQTFPVIDGWLSDFTEVEIHDVSNGTDGIQGAHLLELDDQNLVYQLVDVVPGASYTLRFAVSPGPGQGEDRDFEVRFDGVLVDTVHVPDSSTVDWNYESYTVVPTNALVALEFEDLTGDSSGCYIDDVSLTGPAPPRDRTGEVLYYRRISNTSPGGPTLRLNDMFARGVANIGDLDGNGVVDLAVGTIGWDDDGDDEPGAVWILLLNADGTIKQRQQISQTRGGLMADLASSDGFGRALSGIGDLDLDGVLDIAVGSNRDDEGGSNDGAVYILFLNTDGTVKAEHKITGVSGVDNFDEYPNGEFGGAVTCMGDIDGDGIQDLAIGRRKDHKLVICFMRRDGTVRDSTTISDGQNGFDDQGSAQDWFGTACHNMGDFDGDGIDDVVVGAILDDPYDNEDGLAYILLLNADGTCKDWYDVGPVNVNATNQYIGTFDEYGIAVIGPGDLDGDGVLDLVVGAHRDGPRYGRGLNEGKQKGAIYTLFMNADGTIKDSLKIDSNEGELDYVFADDARWGESLAPLGDFNGDGMLDIVAGSRFDAGVGAAFMLFLNDGTHEPARAEFTVAPQSGDAPLEVTFTDASTGDYTSLLWDFGDGTQSTDPGPIVLHTYQTPGTYTTWLEVSGEGGISRKTKKNIISIADYAAPVAGFSGTPTSGVAPLGVTFADETVGDTTSWSWDFGDGGSSTLQNPTHQYASAGTYDVSLDVTGAGGSDTLALVGYVQVSSPTPPVAGFSASPESGLVPLTVAFTDQTTGEVTGWSWDFGDGGASSLQNPTHQYAAAGTYTVTLTANNLAGSDSSVMVDLIDVMLPPPPLADFSATPLSGEAPLAVSFTDLTTGGANSWAWDFGDGGTSSLQNPTHTYTAVGTYTVMLTVANTGGSDVNAMVDLIEATLPPPPVADFDATPLSGVAPLLVAFSDLTTGGVTSWAWDFGDGGSSSLQNPTHTYDTAGTYTVSLNATGPGGSDLNLMTDLVDVTPPPPPSVDFMGSPLAGAAPLSVTFTDLSTGGATSWAWDFGDGGSSSLQDPSHTYLVEGSYAVSLAATGAGGSSTLLRPDYVVISAPVGGIDDGSFEGQTAGAAPVAPWSIDFGSGHVVNPDGLGSDNAMPTNGSNWVEIGADDTFDATPPSNPGGGGSAPIGGAGVSQSFSYPADMTTLELAAAFVLDGPEDSASFNDWMSVDVTDGSTTVNVFYADTFSEFERTSDKYGLPMTIIEVVKANLVTLFPSSTTSTIFTVTLQVGNGGDDLAPSKGFVDDVKLIDDVAAATVYGCGVNPAGSMTVISGPPRIGETFVIGLDNPLGTQCAGTTITTAYLSTAADALFPCGTPLVGFSMLDPGSSGELLIATPSIVLSSVGSTWNGPGMPSEVSISIPANPSLVGSTYYIQGLMVDSGACGVFNGLTEALEITLGD